MRRGECGSARPRITRLDTSISLEGESARAYSSAASTFSSRLGASSSEGAQPERAGSFCDPITASAPFERVDLVVVGRPRLGGKEPSNDNYRLRFSHALSADRDDGYRDR